MANTWPTCRQLDVDCPGCGRRDRCKIAPDGGRYTCRRGDNKNRPVNGAAAATGATMNGKGYAGRDRKPTGAKASAATGAAPRPAGAKPAGRSFPTAEAAIAAAGRAVRGGTPGGCWTYPDAGGAEVMRVARFDTPGDGKEFRPVHRDGDRWRIGDPPEPLPAYRLNELPAVGRVYVCEGEKAADAARAIGLAATTSAHGASQARRTDWTPLAGKQVVVLPDNDEPGQGYAADVVALLLALDPPATVRVVELPGLPPGGDVVEFVASAPDAMEPSAIAAAINELADAAPDEPDPDAPEPPEPADPYVPFPVDALPGAAGQLVAEGAAALGCDPSFIALPLLAAMAAAIGNSRHLRIKGSWAEPPVLWCVVVGDSGTLKSPAFDLALEATRARQRRATAEHRQAAAAHAEAAEEYEAAIKAWRRTPAAERGDRPAEPTPPPRNRLWCSDATVEALAELLNATPRGLLLARDEWSGWLSSFNQYKSGKGSDAAHWLEMHRAGEMNVDRKTGENREISVPRAAVCIAGGIQPQTLRRCLTPEYMENGMAARLLLAMPPRRVKRWSEADVDPATRGAFETLYGELLKLVPAVGLRNEPRPADVSLTPDARALWVEFYNRHAAEQARLHGELAAAWSKLEGYAARLALVVHCARQASGDPDIDPWHADAASMAAGIRLAEWFGHEARRVYALLAEGEADRARRTLVELIANNGGRATVRELSRCSSLCGSSDEWRAALEQLVDAGLARRQDVKAGAKGGRTSHVYVLVGAAAAGPTQPPPAATGPP